MEWIQNIIVGIGLALSGLYAPVLGAPAQETFHKSLLPITDSSYWVGTTSPSTNAWAGGIFDQLCLTGDTCRTTWPTSGGGSGSGNVATSTNETKGRVPYWTTTSGTPATLGEVSTTSVSAGTGISLTGTVGALLGGTDLTIDTSARDDIATSTGADWAVPNLTYITKTAGLTTFGGVATGTISAGAGISLDSSARAAVGGALQITNSSPLSGLTAIFPFSFSNPTLSWIGLTTTTDSGMVAGNLYVGTGGIFQTAASSSIFGYTPLNPTRQLTIAGTSNQITSSAGAQDLSADRTWTLSLPNLVVFPSNASTTQFSVTGSATSTFILNSQSILGALGLGKTATTTIQGNAATSTFSSSINTGGLKLTSYLDFGGVAGTAWTDFCTTITGSADLCDGSDASGAGTSAFEIATTSDIAVPQVAYFTKTSGMTTLGSAPTTTLTLTSFPANLSATIGALVGGNNATWTWWGLSTTSQPASSNVLTSNGTNGVYGTATTSVSAGTGISFTGTAGALLGGTALTIDTSARDDIATTTDIAVPQLAYFTKTGGLTTLGSVATGTVSAGSTAITVTANRSAIGGALAIDCATASGSQNGCLSSTDYGTFNGKLSSYDAWNHPLVGFSATSSSLTVGTTTTQLYSLTIASSTVPQLVLSSGAGLAQWAFRNAQGNFFLATTSVAGGATSTQSALTINGTTGALSLGTTTAGFLRTTSAGLTWVDSLPLSVANGGTGLTTFGGTNTVLYTTAADTLSSETAFTYAPSTDLLTFVNASSTNLTASSYLYGGSLGVSSTTPWGRIGVTGADTSTTNALIISNSTPTSIFRVQNNGTTTISGITAATSTVYGFSTAASKGAVIILEDVDGAGCTEVSALNGVLSAKTVTCPTEN